MTSQPDKSYYDQIAERETAALRALHDEIMAIAEQRWPGITEKVNAAEKRRNIGPEMVSE